MGNWYTCIFGGVKSKGQFGFVKSYKDIKYSLNLQYSYRVQKISISASKLLSRIIRSKYTKTVPPLKIYLTNSLIDIEKIAKKIAKKNRLEELVNHILKSLKPIKKRGTTFVNYFTIGKRGLKLAKLDKIENLFSDNHYEVQIQSKQLRTFPELKHKLFNQLKKFISKKILNKLDKKINNLQTIMLDHSLLPAFAKKVVKTYTIYQGPNCFYTSMAFQNPTFVQSEHYNIKQEIGYHKSMINHDELWRTVRRHFYEFDPVKSPLKYGDLILFFQIPSKTREFSQPYFRWIRHATTHLFSGFTFSKGSKSPDTPYTVKRLKDEWAFWKRLSKEFGAKFYRFKRDSFKKVSNHSQPQDWLY